MNEQEALNRMVAPGTRRPGKYREGVIQIHVTRACDMACFGCTQGSNLGGKVSFMSLEHFEKALESLAGYWGVVGLFGGNPAMHPQFGALCVLLQKYVPFEQRGIWCNNPLGKGRIMAETFNPLVSNLNCHLDYDAYKEFKRDWPGSLPVGQMEDSRHSPPFVAMKDVLWKVCPMCNGLAYEADATKDGTEVDSDRVCATCHGAGKVYDEERGWELISGCDINQHWSAMIGVFRNELRAWFCEVAGAQSMLHQDDPLYPDTGLDPTQKYCYANDRLCWAGPEDERPEYGPWWELPMASFRNQVRKHCHECGVPLRGYGELSQAVEGKEQTSETHAGIYKPKRRGRPVEVVTELVQLGTALPRMTDYLHNAKR